MTDRTSGQWPVLKKSDELLEKHLRELLGDSITGDTYSPDGQFAQAIASVPRGLRAMAATHWLDISLTLDSITWHFGNFGEPNLVKATEEGLEELGLMELAGCFREAEELMVPLLAEWVDQGLELNDVLERKGLVDKAATIDQKAWALSSRDSGQSRIYEAWVRYARAHPEHVFAT